LLAFGIDSEYFPINQDLQLSTDTLLQYIETKRHEERQLKQQQQQKVKGLAIEIPTLHDVLLGRGIPYQSHPGNINLAKLIEARHVEYCKAGRVEKTSISWEVVKQIQHKFGGRFLVKGGGGGGGTTSCSGFVGGGTSSPDVWMEVADEVARQKSAYGFRSVKKLQMLGYYDDPTVVAATTATATATSATTATAWNSNGSFLSGAPMDIDEDTTTTNRNENSTLV
jgi:hypothetical protein